MTRYRNQTTPNADGKKLFTSYSGATLANEIVKKPALHSKQMYDTVIKDYAKRSAAGEIFNNPVSISTNDFVANDTYESVVSYYNPTNSADQNNGKQARYSWTNGALLTVLNQGTLPWPSVVIDTSKAAAKAALSAIASVNKTEVDTGNFVGEWSKTKLMHRDLLNGVWNLFTEGSKARIRKPIMRKIPVYDRGGQVLLNSKGKPKYRYVHTEGEVETQGSSKMTQNAANLYLIYRMGLAPLIADLEGACKALVSSKNLRQTARGSESLQDIKRTSFVMGDAFGVKHTINLTVVKTWTTRYGILSESTAAGRLAAQFGLTRPLTSAWNLLPWSFVADWFIDTGKWLDAIQPSGVSRYLSAWVSTHETVVYHAEVHSSWNVKVGYETCSGSWNGSLTNTVTFKSRSPWEPAVPTSPPHAEGITTSRAYDLAALMLQRIKTRF